MTKREKIARLTREYNRMKADNPALYRDYPYATAEEQRESRSRILFDIWKQLRRLGVDID
jgi:hypothetical protein